MGLPLTGTLRKNPFKFKGPHTKEPVNKEQVKGLGLVCRFLSEEVNSLWRGSEDLVSRLEVRLHC